jgi:hypothetical protein
MATFTSAAIAGLGAAANIGSAIKQNKLQKQAGEAAKIAAQNMKDVKEQNPFASVQVPTIASKQAMDSINQQSSDTLSALQGAGAEGVIAGATGLSQNVRNAQLDVAAQQNEDEFQRDAMEANAQSGINQRKAERDYYTELSALEGAQMASSDAQYNKNQAIQSAFSGLGAGIGNFADTDKFDYLKEQRSAKKLKRKLKFKPLSDAEQEAEQTTSPTQ